MPMNNVDHIQTSGPYVSDFLQLGRCPVLVSRYFAIYVGKYAIAFTFSHIKRLVVARINEPIHIVPNALCNDL